MNISELWQVEQLLAFIIPGFFVVFFAKRNFNNVTAFRTEDIFISIALSYVIKSIVDLCDIVANKPLAYLFAALVVYIGVYCVVKCIPKQFGALYNGSVIKECVYKGGWIRAYYMDHDIIVEGAAKTFYDVTESSEPVSLRDYKIYSMTTGEMLDEASDNALIFIDMKKADYIVKI